MRVAKSEHSQRGYEISDLRQKPKFFDVIADRVWRAWWQEKGYSVEYIAGRLREALNADPIPFALVAHDGSNFAGTVSVIACDMEERQQYTPWIAAAWVEDAYRRRGIGAALIDHAAHAIFALGIGRTYLCASRERQPFYLKRGWSPIEEDVGKRALTIMSRDSGDHSNCATA